MLYPYGYDSKINHMKKDYFATGRQVAGNSIRKVLLIVLLTVVSFTSYSQSSITIETVSELDPWEISVTTTGAPLTWNATGAVTDTQVGYNVAFNFSSNISNSNISVSTNGTPTDFAGITGLAANNVVEVTPGVYVGQKIYSIDISDLPNLRTLNLDNNTLINLDLSNNPSLTSVSVGNNGSLTSLDISSNTQLLYLNLENTSLSSFHIDNILNTIDSFGSSGGTLIFEGINTGSITANGIQAYINLVGRGWSIRPPQGFDRGDAPDSYLTAVASNGPIHFYDEANDRLRIGTHKDDDLNSSFLPGPNADGDDNDFDPVNPQDDEDGVDMTQFDSFFHTNVIFNMEVRVTSFLSADSYLHAWIDFDGNGSFEDDEYASLTVPSNYIGMQTLSWDTSVSGADVVPGQTYVRIRYTSENTLGSSDVGGVANGGEVEDHTFVMLDGTDTDNDGVPDLNDIDDDNDGILDSVEDNGVTDRDTDGDGIPDRIDLDSDDDTCFDVTEAGWLDQDGDGEVGEGPLTVDADGKVIADVNGPINDPTDAYGPPNDLDGNGTPDFQEAGLAATITTEPTDQDLIIGTSTFTVVAVADVFQWEVSNDGGVNWTPIVDGGDYAGAATASLQVTNSDVSKLLERYRVVVSNIAFACDPTTTSIDVGYITPDDFDNDGIFDIVDVDDDNDGILDTVEDNGVVDRDTDGDGNPDRIDLDADDDGCFDVTEAGFTDNGNGMLGTSVPPVVDANGQVTSATDGYTPPNDLDSTGTPDFQEAGAAATITTQPVDPDLNLGGTTTFSVVATADTYQWQESIDNGVNWVDLVDGGDYSGTTTADLVINTPDYSKVTNRYRVIVQNIGYACDPTTTSIDATFVTPGDFDRDGVFDGVDVDDDNDGILDVDEDDGIVDRDTDGDGNPDRIDLDSDDDGCFDVTEAGFTDDNGDGFLGDFPVSVDVNGQVTSGSDGYTPPNDLDGNGVRDFQEAGTPTSITTQPTDQDLIIGVTNFTIVAVADTYQWEISTDGGSSWVPIVDGGDYTGATSATLQVTHADVSKLAERYRAVVDVVAYACDGPQTSVGVGYITPNDFDNDGVFDIVDVDDDNDGILDTVEDNGVVDRDTDGDGNPDRIDLDADDDGCFDVTEAGFTDNGNGMLGTSVPPVVDANGQVTSATDGYTPPADADGSGTPDFQEAGAAASITTQPTDQNLVPGNAATFSVVATADTYQWQEDRQDGNGFVDVVDGGNYSGATTADLTVSNLDVNWMNYQYRVMVSNVAYACDPVTASDEVGYVNLPDTDNDGVVDLLDVDDDNDGILDTVEDNGVVDRDTDGDGIPDKLQLDADADGCFDVTEAGFTDNGTGMLGNQVPPTVDANGQVTSATDGYTTPNDLDNNGTPDFQEAGTAASLTTQPTDQDFILAGAATFTAASDGDGFQWEVSTDDVNWTPLTDGGQYAGTNTASLTVSNLAIANYFESYRVVATNVAFACDPGDISEIVGYNVLVDTDGDGVFDIVDDDDDNDGILDTVEGMVTDSNLDGRPDRISLDSDSDGCADTREAGFDDPDGDGILGTSPVTVDDKGLVVGQGGYETPWDNNNNGVFDFQEAGAPTSISNQPEDVEVALGEDAVFEVTGTATFYQWQESIDNGATWTDLMNNDQYSGVDTDRMRIIDPRGRLEGNRYRVIMSSPDFVCDPVEELASNAVRLIFNTTIIPSGFSPNGDSINEVFKIPGLIETPDFTMEVFDRWGNSVYKYDNAGSLSPVWWDGRSTGNMTLSKGELVPAGTYFYLIHYNDGNSAPVKGWVYVNY